MLTFADLEAFFRAVFDALEQGSRGDVWRTHHIATIRKVRNRLGNITTRAKGLVTDDGAANDLPWGAFVDRGVYVIDVAGVDPLAQDLVFARVVSMLREHLERRDLGVDHVVVFVDELNKYAPADGPTPTSGRCSSISRSGGGTSGSCSSPPSSSAPRCSGGWWATPGTTIYGRMDPDELATPGYATLSPAIKIKLATLPKGELMIRHPHFTQPVFVRFPRPCVLSGREGVERFPPSSRPAVRRGGGAAAPDPRPVHLRRSGAGAGGRAPGGRCAPGARPDAAGPPRRPLRLLQRGARPSGRAGADHPARRRHAASRHA